MILHGIPTLLRINQRERHHESVKAAICILNIIQLAPKLLSCFWLIFTDFDNQM